MSPFELPAARSGRRPVRLQIRTGFSGPSSRTSASGLRMIVPPLSSARVVERGRAPDHPVARDAVHLVADRPHEVAAAARGDVVREPVRVQVPQQLDHRRVGAREVAPAERRVLRRAQERVGLLLEVVDADARVGGDHAAQERPHVGVVAGVVLHHHLSQPGVVALVRRLPGLLVAERRVGLRHLVEPAQDEVGLDRQRLLAPERAVVVEDRDALGRRHAVRGHALDEVERRRPSRPVVPGCERLEMRSLPGRQCRLELLDHLVDREARRLLPRRELLERLEELCGHESSPANAMYALSRIQS